MAATTTRKAKGQKVLIHKGREVNVINANWVHHTILSSESEKTYTVTLKQGKVRSCVDGSGIGCLGYVRWGHCCHSSYALEQEQHYQEQCERAAKIAAIALLNYPYAHQEAKREQVTAEITAYVAAGGELPADGRFTCSACYGASKRPGLCSVCMN